MFLESGEHKRQNMGKTDKLTMNRRKYTDCTRDETIYSCIYLIGSPLVPAPKAATTFPMGSAAQVNILQGNSLVRTDYMSTEGETMI